MLKITEKDGIVKWEDVPDLDKCGLFVDGKRIFPAQAKNVNLLPKECQMKVRYAVVNHKEKEEFEKKWQMPYGYNNSPKICFNQDEAIRWINQNLGPNERKSYVVERHKSGKIDVVWKILDGPKLAGEQEDEWDDEEF